VLFFWVKQSPSDLSYTLSYTYPSSLHLWHCMARFETIPRIAVPQDLVIWGVVTNVIHGL